MIRDSIRQRMIDLDVTQREVCKFINVREQHLSNFLCGIRTFPFEDLVRIFHALGLTLGEPDKSVGEHSPENMHRAIHKAMEKRDIQRKELSRISGVNASVISSFLCKKRPISLSSLERLIKSLDLTVVCYGTPQIHSKY